MNKQLLLVIVIVIVVFAAGAAWGYYQKQRRLKQMRAVAALLGYEFIENGADLVYTLRGFSHFSQDGSPRGETTNLLRTEADGAAATIFDYSYSVGSGKSRSEVQQSMLLFESERLDLPHFALHPEGLIEKLQGALGWQDIDFEEQPGFSAAYVLEGPDEAQIRALFDSEKLAYFAQRRGLCIEGSGHKLLYYRAGNRISPKAIPSFVEEGLAVLRLLAG